MKIVFLCGSCESGADGVGDYAINLAQALVLLGHECLVVSLYDRYVDGCVVEHVASKLTGSTQVFRLGSVLPLAVRTDSLSSRLRSFNPDWISLQYVPYAFSDKGFPVSLFAQLRGIRDLARWHLMAHELWVDPRDSLKNYFIAVVQRLLLARLLSFLCPSAVHTSNLFYLSRLASIRQSADVLPIFTNISVAESGFNVVFDSVVSQSCWSFICFGSIHPEWVPDLLLKHLEAMAESCQVSRLRFVSIGSAGSHGQALWQRLAIRTPRWFEFEMLGVLPADQISLQLQQADFGITTTPSHLLGKSGSVAAMLAHGLPVIVPRVENITGPWHAAVQADSRFVLLDSNFHHRFRQLVSARRERQLPDHDQLAATAAQFVASLQAVV